MAFNVTFGKQAKPNEYKDGDSYSFLDGGVLSITYGDGRRWTEYHAPGKWEQVTAEPDHPPATGGNSNVLDSVR